MLKRIYEKIITTEPVVYLDLFKGIVLVGAATGFFVLDDARYQAISAAFGILLPTLLTWLTRSSVVSQKTYDKATQPQTIDEPFPIAPSFTQLSTN